MVRWCEAILLLSCWRWWGWRGSPRSRWWCTSSFCISRFLFIKVIVICNFLWDSGNFLISTVSKRIWEGFSECWGLFPLCCSLISCSFANSQEKMSRNLFDIFSVYFVWLSFNQMSPPSSTVSVDQAICEESVITDQISASFLLMSYKLKPSMPHVYWTNNRPFISSHDGHLFLLLHVSLFSQM